MENIGGSLSLICKTSMYYASLCSFLPFSILIFDCLSAKSISLDFIFVSATWLDYNFWCFLLTSSLMDIAAAAAAQNVSATLFNAPVHWAFPLM